MNIERQFHDSLTIQPTEPVPGVLRCVHWWWCSPGWRHLQSRCTGSTGSGHLWTIFYNNNQWQYLAMRRKLFWRRRVDQSSPFQVWRSLEQPIMLLIGQKIPSWRSLSVGCKDSKACHIRRLWALAAQSFTPLPPMAWHLGHWRC